MILYLISWSILSLLVFLYVIRPIGDFDFWWHLKTGDIILQQKSLLTIDPFNYTGDVLVRGRGAITLNGYWLWQIIASALYGAFGTKGIFFLKALTAALIAWALLYAMHRQQLTHLTRVALTSMGVLVLIDIYNLERPHVLTIFFLTVLIGMISRIRMGHSPSRMLFPLMIIWSNIHGGFVVGDIVLGLAAAGFLIQYRQDTPLQLRMLAWATAGILASFINPNGWSPFIEIFNFISSHVYEYRNSWQLFLDGSRMSAGMLWTLAALHLISLLLVNRRYWAEIFISLFIIAFGLKYIRNTGFIAISLLPMTGWYAEQAYTRFHKNISRSVQLTICVVMMAVISWQVPEELQKRETWSGPVAPFFPINMATFLKSSGFTGNLFNDYDSGGYLDWTLYPQWKTFIDSRELDSRVFGHYSKILYGSMDYAEGKPLYEHLLDSYQVDVIALKIAFSNGRLQPLLKLLLQNSQWIPVFLDNQSFILVRDTPLNAAAIKQYRLDKTRFLETLTRQIGTQLKLFPDDIPHLVVYADILKFAGKLPEAEPIMIKLASIKNLDPEIMSYLNNQ